MIPAYALELLKKLAGWIATAVFLVTLAAPWVSNQLTGTTYPVDIKTALSWFAAAYGVALVAFDQWVWRLPIGRWMGWQLPDIKGTWQGTLMPTDLPNGLPLPAQPIPIYLVVRQTAFSLKLTMYTNESKSRTVSAEFAVVGEELQLVYSYHNTPELQHQHRSPIHIGTAVLDMASVRPQQLEGYYFTQRLSRGQMKLGAFNPHLAQHLDDARAMTFAPRSIRR